jgi:peptidoglycan/LPS O-acetylase OafA/YrhL
MIDFKYRPDVDGLRAVAVTLVLLFHAGLGFSGGFIGVDVFFVISGFLITGLILKEQDAGMFSLANFWVRRIRRIIPAATVMVVAVMVAGFFLLLPSDYEDLGKSTIAQQVMLSNVYFWRNTGYFDGPADMKPLLHTWSLAVEEQFYLGYPFLLMLLHRQGRKTMFVTLMVLGIGSLAISEYGVHHHPSATFFLLPTRAWELLLGGLICFLPKPTRMPLWLLAATSWLSLATILGAGWFYTSTTPFPGFSALVPCAATAALIYANAMRLTFPAAVLATKPMVFIGLMSYSLYLWHWPVLALSRYWLIESQTFAFGLLAVVASVPLAFVSWKYVETPLRRAARNGNSFNVGLAAAFSAMAVVGLASWVYRTDGFSARLPEHVKKIAEAPSVPRDLAVGIEEIQLGKLPVIGVPTKGERPPDFLVWGDSHAMALGGCFNSVANEMGLSGLIAARPGTVPILGVWRPAYRDNAMEAPEWNQEVIKFIQRTRVQNVILVSRWAVNVEGRPSGKMDSLIANEGETTANASMAKVVFDSGLSRTLEELESLGVRVWILKQVPLQPFAPARSIVRSVYLGREIPRGTSFAEHIKRQANANRIIDQNVMGRQLASAIDLSEPYFANGDESVIGDAQGSYYCHDNHVSEHGAEILCRPTLASILAEVAASGGRE